MKPFNYDPLKDNAPKSTTTSQKRLLAEIGQKAISDMTRKISSNETNHPVQLLCKKFERNYI